MENYQAWLASDDPALWEQTYLHYVTRGVVSIDEYVLDWLSHRVELPASKEYSIFSPNVLVDTALLNVRVKLGTQSQGKTRYVYMMVWTDGELHPGFEYLHEPDEENKRFESIGNPFIDGPNYRIWEEY